MKKISNKIVFFGSGPVAAESLRLLQAHTEVEAVITKDSTKREMAAITKSAPVFTANTKAELDTLISSQTFESRLGILIDFGIIVSQDVIDSFERGIINSHFSLLPEWRGADPITFSILSGQKQTGVSLMLLVQAMDEGPILAQGIYDIKDFETTPTLTHELILLSDALLRDTAHAYLNDIPHPETSIKTIPRPQEDVNKMWQKPLAVSYSRKLTKADGILDFNKPAEQLEREIRGFIEWPKSRTEIAGKDVVITKVSVDNDTNGTIGTVYKTSDKKIGIYTSKGSLVIEALKPAGKKEMPVQAFLAGYSARL
jgi:methionyl-tRNA formyltransferase